MSWTYVEKIREASLCTRDGRYYLDARHYADVGGGQEALKPEGSSRATTDPELARTLAEERVQELRDSRIERTVLKRFGIREQRQLEEFGSFHLKEKEKAGVSSQWLGTIELHLERACAFFGTETDLTAIDPAGVRRWIEHLRQLPNGRGLRCPECGRRAEPSDGSLTVACPEEGCERSWQVGALGEKSVRDHINSLSNLYRRAQQEQAVPSGYNPVADLVDKPTPERVEREDWLEPHEAALLLEAARTYEPPEDKHGHGFIFELVATAVLTGLRRSELLGLTVQDVSFDSGIVRVRPNEHRGLKTKRSRRDVPLWPQLREILQRYIFGGDAPRSGLLFPSPRTGKMLRECRKQLDAVGDRAGFEEGRIRFHALRHTYTATRIQTYDLVKRPGADGEAVEQPIPVPLYTVARELGHASTRLIEERYGHLAQNPDRRPVVEFRAAEHAERLGERLRALQAA